MFQKRDLYKDVVVVYVDGKNPDSSARNKDIWDSKEDDTTEKDAFELVLQEIDSAGLGIKVIRFQNDFTTDSIQKIINIVKDVRNNTN
jgi:hypothetical protein